MRLEHFFSIKCACTSFKANFLREGLFTAGGIAEAFVLTMDGPFEQKTGGARIVQLSRRGTALGCEAFATSSPSSASSPTSREGNVDVTRSPRSPST